MQLELFNVILEKANLLIDALNDQRKPKDLYFGLSIQVINKMYLISAINNKKDLVFNILDQSGAPLFGSCWRVWGIVSSELNIKIDDLDKFELLYSGRVVC